MLGTVSPRSSCCTNTPHRKLDPSETVLTIAFCTPKLLTNFPARKADAQAHRDQRQHIHAQQRRFNALRDAPVQHEVSMTC